VIDKGVVMQKYGRWGWLKWRLRLIRNWLYWCVYFRTIVLWPVAYLTPPRYSDTEFKPGEAEHIISVAKLHGVDGWDDTEGMGG
jgi:hypothetical protein